MVKLEAREEVVVHLALAIARGADIVMVQVDVKVSKADVVPGCAWFFGPSTNPRKSRAGVAAKVAVGPVPQEKASSPAASANRDIACVWDNQRADGGATVNDELYRIGGSRLSQNVIDGVGIVGGIARTNLLTCANIAVEGHTLNF